MNAQLTQKPNNHINAKSSKQTTNGKTNLTRAQKTLINEVLLPLGGLAIVLAGATAVAYVFDSVLVHPNLHPRLVRATYDLIHFHPRIWKLAQMAFWGTLIMLPFMRFLVPIFTKYQWRKKAKIVPAALKSQEYLNKTIKQSIPLLLPQVANRSGYFAWNVYSHS